MTSDAISPPHTDAAPMPGRAVVDIVGLHKSFGANEVLKGIDLQINEGEVVCLIGPSGSGTSTSRRCPSTTAPPPR